MPEASKPYQLASNSQHYDLYTTTAIPVPERVHGDMHKLTLSLK